MSQGSNLTHYIKSLAITKQKKLVKKEQHYQDIFRERITKSIQALEHMLKISIHLGHANENHNEISPRSNWNGSGTVLRGYIIVIIWRRENGRRQWGRRNEKQGMNPYTYKMNCGEQ